MTLGEMGEDKLVCSSLDGDLGCLCRGEVTIFLGKARFGFQIGRLAHEEIDAFRQVKCSVTDSGIHDEGHGLAFTHLAEVTSLMGYAVEGDVAVLDQLTNVGTIDASLMEPVSINPELFGLLDAVANGVHSVIQVLGRDDEIPDGAVGSISVDRHRHNSDRVMPDGAGSEPLKVLGAVGWVPDGDWLSGAVKSASLQKPRQA